MTNTFLRNRQCIKLKLQILNYKVYFAEYEVTYHLFLYV